MSHARTSFSKVIKAKINYYPNVFIKRIVEAVTNETRQFHNSTEVSYKDVIANQQVIINSLEKQLTALSKVHNVVKADHENINQSRNQVFKLRKSEEYQRAYSNLKPLISIRIATYNKGPVLVDRTIKSILNQTYQNFEICIVGDHCTDDTEERIKKLNDPRVTFVNLPHQSIYPEDRIDKWRVIGALPMNYAASMASGVWIAPLDDDDEFSPDHLETLLQNALTLKSEMIYGAMLQKNLTNGETKKIWSSTPEEGKFSFNGALYLAALHDIFQYDQSSWTLEEPGDWNMCKRMLESGVKVHSINHNVGILNMIPAGHEQKDY